MSLKVGNGLCQTHFTAKIESGLFRLLLQVINTDAHRATVLEFDSTFCKVHQSACLILKDQAIGASHGGKNNQIHVLINDRMQLLKVILTADKSTTLNPILIYLPALSLRLKKFSPTKLIFAIKFAITRACW